MDNYIFIKDSSRERPKNIAKSVYDSAEYGGVLDAYSPEDVPLSRYIFSSSYSHPEYKKLRSLKNTINYYFGTDPDYNYDKLVGKPISIIGLSSYHLASGLQKGSISLSVYDSSNVLLDRATDLCQNGILYNTTNQSVGFVLYNEGFFVLTSTASIDSTVASIGLTTGVVSSSFRWHHFGVSSSINITSKPQYQAVADTVTNLTMIYANKGELNHSNNPTYLQSGSYTAKSSSYHFSENDTSVSGQNDSNIKNTVKSPFTGATGSFDKQTFISKIGMYDNDKKLVAVASLSKPIRKTDNREFLFKIKLDM